MTKQQAAAAVLAALTDPNLTHIGDPVKQKYGVAFQLSKTEDALELARQLVRIGITPRTTIEHDGFLGDPLGATVTVWGKDDQRVLLEAFGPQLDERQREKLLVLVLTRGPIPEDILERMSKGRERGWNFGKIAKKMNKQGIVEGRKGGLWTASKVKKALIEYYKQHGPWSGAVELGV